MPTLLEEKEIRLEWTDIEKRVAKTRVSSMQRTSGVHLSGVIRYALKKAGLWQNKPEETEDEMPLMIMLGMFWEEGVVSLYPDLIWQPGEVELDDVYGSPDGLTGQCLEEFKFTKKSYYTRKSRLILEEKLWMWQLMGYCRMLGLTQARLHVLWVDGAFGCFWVRTDFHFRKLL